MRSAGGRLVLAQLTPFITGLVLGATLCASGLYAWRAAPREPVTADPVRTPAEAYRWDVLPAPAFPIPPYAKFLNGVRVVLDPGHVGQRDPGGDWKRGPTGLREAEVNLRVAHFLREFLDAAGAEVVLTRSEDVCLDLPDAEDLAARAEVANAWPADVMISIHHNGSRSPEANYTSLFYHESPEHSRASAKLATALLSGLNDALRLDRHLECAVLNDRVLFDSGLAVLRQSRVPAVLSEASFHSNPDEEMRLRDPAYNRREAYGLFLGLTRWAQAGLPRMHLESPTTGAARAGDTVAIKLDDGLSARGGWGADRNRIDVDSIIVRCNGARLTHTFNVRRRELRVRLPRRIHGPSVVLRVDFANVLGQPVLHPLLEVDARR